MIRIIIYLALLLALTSCDDITDEEMRDVIENGTVNDFYDLGRSNRAKFEQILENELSPGQKMIGIEASNMLGCIDGVTHGGRIRRTDKMEEILRGCTIAITSMQFQNQLGDIQKEIQKGMADFQRELEKFNR